MHIVQLITERERRGAQVFARQLSEQLMERGHQITFLSLYKAEGNEMGAPDGATVIDLGHARNIPLSPALLRDLVDQLRAEPPDLVQANGSDTLKYSVLAKMLLWADWPLAYRNIGYASDWVGGRPFRRFLSRTLIRGVDRVISVCEATRSDYIATYGVPPEKVATVPIGTSVPDTVDTSAARERLEALTGTPAPPEAPLLVHAGSFTRVKNQEGLLRIFREVLQHTPDAQLVLFGDGPLWRDINSAVSRNGLHEHVHLPGNVENLPPLMAGADLMLLPSKTEGLPGVVLEASAHQVPCVAYDVGGIKEAIRQGETGVLVPKDDEDAFARSIMELLSDSERRSDMGAAAQELVARNYTLEAVGKRFDIEYVKLLEQ